MSDILCALRHGAGSHSDVRGPSAKFTLEMFSTAAHDIYVVRGRYGEVLIPAVKEFIVEIDRDDEGVFAATTPVSSVSIGGHFSEAGSRGARPG